MSAAQGDSVILTAALAYAARGWPVFPCSPQTKKPMLPRDIDPETKKPIKGSGGLNKASTDPAQIREWWAKWPKAMIGLCTGFGRLFVIDFDPRKDEEAGKEWTLEQLRADLEAQMGCALPSTLTSITRSGGVHCWFLWPDDGGAPIVNRGNLPEHVDVRGKGGYVIAPPSVMSTGKDYHWLRRDGVELGPDVAAIVDAPAALVEILRTGDGKGVGKADRAAAAPRADGPTYDPSAVSEAQRKYALTAFDREIGELARTQVGGGKHGGRNMASYHHSFFVGQLVGAGALSMSMARAALLDAIKGFGSDHSEAVENGLAAGVANPRDLSGVGQLAGTSRGPRHGERPPPHGDVPAGPPGPAFAPAERRSTLPASGTIKPNGRVETLSAQPERTVWRLRRMAKYWLEGRRRKIDAMKDQAEIAKAITSFAWGVGRRAAAGLFDVQGPLRLPRKFCEAGAGPELWAEIVKSRANGERKGYDIGPDLIVLRSIERPLTDMGNSERFHLRYGASFRFATAKGWLGWDDRRWAVLDQDKDNDPAELRAAVFAMVRSIQDEARLMEVMGMRDALNPHGMDYMVPKGPKWIPASMALAEWGRTSESAGKLGCIANLAKRWLTVAIEKFDCDPLAVNVMNGTLRFGVETGPDGAKRAWVQLEPHERLDLNTRLAPVIYDPQAVSPVYDAFFEWAQPKASMRRYLHAWAGYSISGDISEQKLQFWYGLGANGKSTAIDAWAHVGGDYAGTIGIETFLDQGIKKRGEQASPDLARLGGVRLLRASEPERGAKLNEALIKAATGGEPMAVRALHRGFFDLYPQFKLTIGGNYRPDIPGTDEGIWRRMKLIPWEQHRKEEDKDLQLASKLKGEASGILNHIVGGLLDWLENGLVEPEEVRAATAQYREDSDPLARFLKLCTEADDTARIQSSRLHAVYAAWCKVAGEKEWTQKGFTKAMLDKGHKKKASDGMQWLGMRLVKDVGDFVDGDGRPLEQRDDEADGPPRDPAADPRPWDDPDFVPF